MTLGAKPLENRGCTWRIISLSKWLVSPTYKPFSPFGRGPTIPQSYLLRGLTNHGYQPLTNWDDPPSNPTKISRCQPLNLVLFRPPDIEENTKAFDLRKRGFFPEISGGRNIGVQESPKRMEKQH